KVTSYVSYDDWGALTAKAVLKISARELDLVNDYTGHPYDMVLGAYYAKARMYDAKNRRFMAVDPVKGTVADPQTMVQYTYCLDNPIAYVDPLGLFGFVCDGPAQANVAGAAESSRKRSGTANPQAVSSLQWWLPQGGAQPAANASGAATPQIQPPVAETPAAKPPTTNPQPLPASIEALSARIGGDNITEEGTMLAVKITAGAAVLYYGATAVGYFALAACTEASVTADTALVVTSSDAAVIEATKKAGYSVIRYVGAGIAKEVVAEGVSKVSFPSTKSVTITGERAIDQGHSYEAAVRDALYNNTKKENFTAIVNGQRVNGQADAVTTIAGKRTAVEAKYVDNWSESLRNPASSTGYMSWSVAEQQKMLDQAAAYSSGFPGGVVYHTNSVELATHYTNIFNDAGITNFKFIITPAAK
ncbi:MAG: hypothetical protein FWG53_05335, partial [Clostridiales bacterium]|nr:hypothetical protein [Clostridiales bacterium]